MEEKLVSFDTAILSKDKGFNEPCDHFYIHRYGNSFHKNHGKLSKFENKRNNLKGQPHIIVSPTQSLLQNWLRVKYKIYVHVEPCGINQFSTHTTDSEGIDLLDVFQSESYEEALERGLYESLLLIF